MQDELVIIAPAPPRKVVVRKPGGGGDTTFERVYAHDCPNGHETRAFAMAAVPCPYCAADRAARAEQLLRGFVEHEDRPCSFDHHGYCQEHGMSDTPCLVREGRNLLGLDAP